MHKCVMFVAAAVVVLACVSGVSANPIDGAESAFSAPRLAPDPPSNLGPPGLVSGIETADRTPTFSFDLVGDDALAYQIQIDVDSDLTLIPVVDFTSVFSSEGSFSFTVGQAAAGGAYVTGSQEQALALGVYFWRARSFDSVTGESSGWATANDGAAAFVIRPEPTTLSLIAIGSLTFLRRRRV